MKLAIIALAALALTGCEKAAMETITTGSDGDFQVSRLFTVDDCTAYRFYDNGRAVYYTNCKGSTNSEHREGKHTKQRTVSTYQE